MTSRSVALALLAVLLAAGCELGHSPGSGRGSEELPSETQPPTEHWLRITSDASTKPYLWDIADNQRLLEPEEILNSPHPLKVAEDLYRRIVTGRPLPEIVQVTEILIGKYDLENAGMPRYGFPYRDLLAGWWSGMAASLLALDLAYVYKATGNTRYRSILEKYLPNLTEAPPNGGITWHNSDGCWFSEYAWEAMAEGDEYYVLNGHLYALQAIKMLAIELDDARFEGLYECGLNRTRATAAQFHRRPWHRYMLNPRTIDPVHYVIFETIQFDALYDLDPQEFYLQEAEARRTSLRAFFPVYQYFNGDRYNLVLPVIGPPHPYDIDTYPIRARCEDEAGAELTFGNSLVNDDSLGPLQRGFAAGSSVLRVNRCDVYSDYLGRSQRIWSGSPVDVAPPSDGHSLAFLESARWDAVQTAPGQFRIDPSIVTRPDEPSNYANNQGRIEIELTDALILEAETDLIGIMVEPDRNLAIGVGFAGTTSTGESLDIFRYYPPVEAGLKNLILLSKLGFDRGEELHSLKSATLVVYTAELKNTSALSLFEVRAFSNALELRQYLEEHEDVHFYAE